MSFRRALAVAGAVVLAASTSVPAYAQDKKPDAEQQQRKLSNDEKREYVALNELVDAVTAGKQPAPADIKLKFQNHFLRSSKNVYIPYVLEISGGTFSSYPVTMYVRAVRKAEAGAAPQDPRHRHRLTRSERRSLDTMRVAPRAPVSASTERITDAPVPVS